MPVPARHAQRPVLAHCIGQQDPKQNAWLGFTLVSQSVSCCQAGKCSLVFSKDLLIIYIVFCARNLSGYLTHVVELTGAIWPSSSFRSALIDPRISQAEKLDSCRMNHGEYLLTYIDALPSTVNFRLFLERSAWNLTIKCELTTVYWTGHFEQRLTVSWNCNRLPWEIWPKPITRLLATALIEFLPMFGLRLFEQFLCICRQPADQI